VIYEFLCPECPGTKVDDDGRHVACLHERQYPIKKRPKMGLKVKCPCCGRNTAARILSSNIGVTVKHATEYNWRPGERMRMPINGQEMSFEFVDHKHTDPAYQRNLNKLANKHNISQGMGRARYDPKHGRVVVDVASSVPDPLGAIARSQAEARQRGGYEQQTRQVNQPVKRRGNFKSPIPVGEAMRRAQAKRAKS
jgi:hypothetical protein